MADESDPGAPASAPVPTLYMVTAPTPLQQVEGGWLLDLGQVEAGTLLRTFRFGVLNDAAPGADALTVRFETAADPEFRVFAPDAFENIVPRQARGEVDVILDATVPGFHESAITLHPERIGADGSVTALPDLVVTMREEVVGTLDAAAIPAGGYAATLAPERLTTTPVTLDGQDFARIQNLGGWSGSGRLDFAPDEAAAAGYGKAYLLATFQEVHADFAAAGIGHHVEVVGAESGRLALAWGDTALWSFISGGGAGGATITTAGDATVRVTALGADWLDDRIAVASLQPWNIYPFSPPRGTSSYDGHLSTATVELGGSGNTVTAEAAVNLVVTGGEGHNHVVGGGGSSVIALTGRCDWLESGSGQTTFVEQAGSLRGDWITGFKPGDLIRFEGFAPDAELQDLGGGRYRVVDGEGRHERFHVEASGPLVQGSDYLFA